MKIAVVGGGPAGLYFALLAKRRQPANEIMVYEQNPAGATYGWGVVFSDRALGFLRESDPESYADLERSLETWDDQVIVHRGREVRIDGIGFSGLARLGGAGALESALVGTVLVVAVALVLDGLLVLLGRFTVSKGLR